jgi:hypothetical protein
MFRPSILKHCYFLAPNINFHVVDFIPKRYEKSQADDRHCGHFGHAI